LTKEEIARAVPMLETEKSSVKKGCLTTGVVYFDRHVAESQRELTQRELTQRELTQRQLAQPQRELCYTMPP